LRKEPKNGFNLEERKARYYRISKNCIKHIQYLMDLALQVLDLESFITCAIRISGVMVLHLSLSLSTGYTKFRSLFKLNQPNLGSVPSRRTHTFVPYLHLRTTHSALAILSHDIPSGAETVSSRTLGIVQYPCKNNRKPNASEDRPNDCLPN